MQGEVYRLTRTYRGTNRVRFGRVRVRVRVRVRTTALTLTLTLILTLTNDLFVSFLEDVQSVYR